MVSVLDFQNYRKFIKARFLEMPMKGYGKSRRLAEYLNVHTTLVSQVLNGYKSFTPEQAALACEFFELTEYESDYLLLLIHRERAGNETLRQQIERQIILSKKKAKELSNRLQSEVKLSEENRAIFYSNWVYTAVRQATAIEGVDTPDKIADFLGISKKIVKEAVTFLLKAGLCKAENGKIGVRVKATHLESTSPWVRTHHANWRMKGLDFTQNTGPTKLHYTCPMTISKEDASKIREMIAKFLETLDPIIDKSASEELHCLNIDWFQVGK